MYTVRSTVSFMHTNHVFGSINCWSSVGLESTWHLTLAKVLGEVKLGGDIKREIIDKLNIAYEIVWIGP
nr:hypothetical protein MACL_00003200 [Theileria orientalis]